MLNAPHVGMHELIHKVHVAVINWTAERLDTSGFVVTWEVGNTDVLVLTLGDVSSDSLYLQCLDGCKNHTSMLHAKTMRKKE